MKFFLFLCLALTSLSLKAESETNADRAIQVKFFGGITGFDPGAYKAVRATVSAFIAEGTVDHFITTSVGLEGGSSFCIELSPNPALNLEPILGALRSIHPTSNSVYSFEASESCSAVKK